MVKVARRHRAQAVLFDTSVLIAGLADVHPNHARAYPWLRRAQAGEIRGFVCAHALAETFANLNTAPLVPAIPIEQALTIVEGSLLKAAHLACVELVTADYLAAMRLATARKARSGAIYDALHVIAARKVGARILTTDSGFARLAESHELIEP